MADQTLPRNSQHEALQLARELAKAAAHRAWNEAAARSERPNAYPPIVNWLELAEALKERGWASWLDRELRGEFTRVYRGEVEVLKVSADIWLKGGG